MVDLQVFYQTCYTWFMTKYANKLCQRHGNTEHVLEGRGYYRCKACRVESTTRKRKRLKQKAVVYKGGCCEKCGYDKCLGALQFHHPDDNKEFNVSARGNTHSWERVKAEVDKCELLCANCHAETHYKELSEFVLLDKKPRK